MHMRSPVGASLPRAAQRVAVRISRSQPRQEFREFDLRWSRPWKRGISKTVYCRSWEERAVNQLSRFRISLHFIRFCRIASDARAVPLVLPSANEQEKPGAAPLLVSRMYRKCIVTWATVGHLRYGHHDVPELMYERHHDPAN